MVVLDIIITTTLMHQALPNIRIWFQPITKINTHDTALNDEPVKFGNYFNCFIVVNLDIYNRLSPSWSPPNFLIPPKGEILE